MEQREKELYDFIKLNSSFYYLGFEEYLKNFTMLNTYLIKRGQMLYKTLDVLYTDECKKYPSIQNLIREEMQMQVILKNNVDAFKNSAFKIIRDHKLSNKIDMAEFQKYMIEYYNKHKTYNFSNIIDFYNKVCEYIISRIV